MPKYQPPACRIAVDPSCFRARDRICSRDRILTCSLGGRDRILLATLGGRDRITTHLFGASDRILSCPLGRGGDRILPCALGSGDGILIHRRWSRRRHFSRGDSFVIGMRCDERGLLFRLRGLRRLVVRRVESVCCAFTVDTPPKVRAIARPIAQLLENPIRICLLLRCGRFVDWSRTQAGDVALHRGNVL